MKVRMTSVHKITLRIFGLSAVLAGIVLFSFNIMALSKLLTIQNVITQFFGLALDCFLLFGGFQLLKFKAIGHKSLLTWFGGQIPTTILVLSSIGYDAVFPDHILIRSEIPTSFFVGFYLFCAIMFVVLWVIRFPKELIAEDHPQWHITATLLSRLLPGFGRALVSNLFAGIGLFYIYAWLMTARVRLDVTPTYLSWLAYSLYYLVVWRIFSTIDWMAVKRSEKSEQRVDPAPDLAPKQVNGG